MGTGHLAVGVDHLTLSVRSVKSVITHFLLHGPSRSPSTTAPGVVAKRVREGCGRIIGDHGLHGHRGDDSSALYKPLLADTYATVTPDHILHYHGAKD
jgi:hypothetical protein